jgi:hypothetical protein
VRRDYTDRDSRVIPTIDSRRAHHGRADSRKRKCILRCAEMMPDLPPLVGLGSVCRRSLGGRAGIIRVLSAIDVHLPRGVKVHLFGVKGAAIGALAGHPRVHSMDSQAWDYAARREKERDGQNFNLAYREGHMRRWYETQRSSLGLFA